MGKSEAVIIILLIVIIVGFGYVLLVKYPPLLESAGGGSGSAIITTMSTDEEGTSSVDTVYVSGESVSYVYGGEVLGTTSDIKSLDIWAEPLDWNSEPGNDGITLHFTFYDAQGRKVIFSGTSITTQITVYSPSINIYGQTINPRSILYKGYTTITSSDEGNDTPYGGIRVPYSSIVLSSTDLGIGQIKMTATMPTGGSIEAYETFPWLKS